jgi:ankyrin repeat protein
MLQLKYSLASLPPLHRAAGAGDVAEVLRLLDAGADIDAPADTFRGAHDAVECGLTPLMVGAGNERGSAEVVRTLLKRGANPRSVSAAGVDALWYAAAEGDPERVAALLAALARMQRLGQRRERSG